jgi:hypothetical protein
VSKDWSNIEIELIIADYFDMFRKELSGISYNKTVHRHYLLPLLSNRSEGSVEYKHQNISAILIALGQPYINGYLPRYNYQKLLEDKVIGYLTDNANIEEQFKDFANKKVVATKNIMFESLIVDPPKTNILLEPSVGYRKNPITTNYLEKEQSSKILGRSGEELIFSYEKWYLLGLGKEKYANQVRWISMEEGDGAGFDILSKNLNGSDRYIEVKTTKLPKETPFYFTRNELMFSTSHSIDYHLYRLFNFEKDVRMFIKIGSLDKICHSIPMTYKGFFQKNALM